jgi:two-component system, chemotaxis family, CheB/CheR fusion protein
MRTPARTKSPESTKPKQARPDSESSSKQATFPVVGIGASAGGLEAFTELLKHLPEKTGMAFVLVQHMDPRHGSALTEILSRTTKIPVTQVTDGVRVEPDHIYVIPANANMTIKDGVLRLTARALVQGQHMPINHFLNSLATDRGDQAISVILSGTASDGTEGCLAIKAAGGITFAQDEKSARYSSMPRSALGSGSIDFVMPPADIARELRRIGSHPYLAYPPAGRHETREIAERRELDSIYSLLQDATGVDFAHYKQSTMQRRIKRRMVVHHLENLKDYVRYIRSHTQELDQLYRDILIHVTGFFRDPEAFEALRTTVYPKLFKDRKANEWPIRIWIPGCSTGEEVYSFAISLLDYTWQQSQAVSLASATTKRLQIFATDVSDQALDQARMGLYTESAVAGVSQEPLKRFFLHTDGGYQIHKSVREMVVFAKQNLVKDPPFSNLDLVSCRNVLIYLGADLQKRVIPMLHYALKPGGYLMLGGSENLGAFTDYFTLVDKKNKIYQKKYSPARLISFFSGAEYRPHRAGSPPNRKVQPDPLSLESEVERILLNRFVPASIVVNSEMEIVQFRGKTGAYLEPAPGHPTFSLSKMAREGLLVDLRAAITQARKANTPARREGVRVQSNGGVREVDLEVIPTQGQAPNERFCIVVFRDAPQGESGSKRSRKQEGRRAEKAAAARERERTAQEVKQLREQLQALIEDHETTLEEYKSANEEVLSANEELQSTNEELETAKEELQSTNEELTTLNEELQNRNVELSLANNDLVNLFGVVNIPVVIVGNDLRIRRFTPPAQKLLNLQAADMGRKIGEIRPNVEFDSMEQMVRDAIDSATAHEREVRDVESGGWLLLRVRPYKTFENKIDGAVISFLDIDVFKRSVEQVRGYADALIENAREPILVLDGDLRVAVANRAFYAAFQVSPAETEGTLIYELGQGHWNIPSLRTLFDAVTGSGARIDDFEVRQEFPKIGPRTMLLNARRIEPQEGKPMILLSIEDVSERAQHLDALRRQAALLDLARDAVFTRDLEGHIQYWNHGAEELYGWTSDEAIGKSAYELLRTEFPKPVREIQEDLSRTGHWEGELVHTRRDGSKRVVNSRWALRQEDAAALVLEINSDITDQTNSEDALRRLSGRLMRIQDEERRRIARELHDSTGQKLTALKISLGMVQSRLDPQSKEYTSLAECLDFADQSMQDIRTLSQLLHPPTLEEAGLGSAIRWLVEGFSSRSGIKVHLSLPGELRRIPQEIEITLFRVLQEALNNVHRHAEATSAKIQLVQKNQTVTLTVSDDGKGVPAEVLSGATGRGLGRSLGVGMLGMEERLAQFGGTLDIRNNRKGATVTVSVPVPAEGEDAKGTSTAS